MAFPDLLDSSLRMTDAIYYGRSAAGGTSVPTSRQILTSSPLTGGGDLTADRTIAITLSGGGSGAVGTGRTISTTAPLFGGGDLSANRTLQIAPFSGSVDGIVTHNPSGVQGKFLKDDNTWGTSTGSGVTSVTGTTPVVASPTVGDVIISVPLVGIANQGIVPATGGADSTKFLCATNPPTWANPALGAIVALQGSYPGTADSGFAHVTNKIGADVGFVAGTNSPDLDSRLFLLSKISDPSTVPTESLNRFTNDSTGPNIFSRKSRGTESSKSATQDNDSLFQLQATGFTSGGTHPANQTIINVAADGNSGASEVPAYTDIIGGAPVSGYHRMRFSQSGVIVQNQQMGTSTRAKSSFEVKGSFGLRVTNKTTDFTAGSNDCIYTCDTTGTNPNDLNVTLPDATTCAGRVYGFCKVDSLDNTIEVGPSGAQTVGGQTGQRLVSQGDFLMIVSDGSNWWVIDSNLTYGLTNTADGSAIANSTGEQTAVSFVGNYPVLAYPKKFLCRAGGKFSTTGTPTLRFKVKNNAHTMLFDSGTVTMPNGVTDATWSLEVEMVVRGLTSVRATKGILAISQLAGSGAVNMYNMVDLSVTNPVGSGIPGEITVQWGTASTSNSVTVLQAECFCSPLHSV